MRDWRSLSVSPLKTYLRLRVSVELWKGKSIGTLFCSR